MVKIGLSHHDWSARVYTLPLDAGVKGGVLGIIQPPYPADIQAQKWGFGLELVDYRQTQKRNSR